MVAKSVKRPPKRKKWEFGRKILMSNYVLSWCVIGVMCIAILRGVSVTAAVENVVYAMVTNLSATLLALIGGKAFQHNANLKWGKDDEHENADEPTL